MNQDQDLAVHSVDKLHWRAVAVVAELAVTARVVLEPAAVAICIEVGSGGHL